MQAFIYYHPSNLYSLPNFNFVPFFSSIIQKHDWSYTVDSNSQDCESAQSPMH